MVSHYRKSGEKSSLLNIYDYVCWKYTNNAYSHLIDLSHAKIVLLVNQNICILTDSDSTGRDHRVFICLFPVGDPVWSQIENKTISHLSP